jgi:hypothetical protein
LPLTCPADRRRPYALRKALTIIREPAPRPDPQALALAAVAWTVGDERRGQRLLALTGLDADGLRAGLGDPGVLGAVLDFLLAHEADLVEAAEHLGVEPQALVRARAELGA